MDTESGFCRRQSSEEVEKTPGETETSQSYVYMNCESESTEMILKEKLSAALENIKEKESLVNQHAKVAEEAITGWEKAEKEASNLKQKASSLEDRVIKLDWALKECLKRLREATRIDLKLELQERYKELEILKIERDCSIQLAKTAKKQHLESEKKVAELESECQQLKDRSVGRNRLFSPSVEIICLMDDFLEMERLVALAEGNENKVFNIRILETKMKYGIDPVNTESLRGDLKSKQEKNMEIATSKFRDCMKTIASLNRGLKFLTTFDSLEDLENLEVQMLHLNWTQVTTL